jgi:large subunit ribosomal protein L21
MSYAIISLGGKQYRVSEGQRLLVDRLPAGEGGTLTPAVLLVGGDGAPALAPKDVTVTVKVLGEERGPKIRIGKYKKRTGYKRHTGFRAALTQIEIESIGTKKRAEAKPKEAVAAPPVAEPQAAAAAPAATAAPKAPAKPKPAAAAKPKAPAKPKPAAAARPKAPAKPKPAARKAKPAAAPTDEEGEV